MLDIRSSISESGSYAEGQKVPDVLIILLPDYISPYINRMKGTTWRHTRKEFTTGGAKTKTRKRMSNTKSNTKSNKPRMGRGFLLNWSNFDQLINPSNINNLENSQLNINDLRLFLKMVIRKPAYLWKKNKIMQK